jgi:hypothetical protein
LDADLTGLPCGPKAALATKGYFAKQRYRRGRQLGRVLATRYQEVVIDQLYSGTTYLRTALFELMLAAERTLQLDEAKRRRTILRIDAGAGSVEDINWALSRGYQVHAKDYSGQRARILADSVTEWVEDPQVPGRQVGWVQIYRFVALIQRKFFDHTTIRLLERPVPVAEREKNELKMQVVPWA